MKRSVVGIVGGSGYIGSRLSAYLSQTFDVKIIDKIPPKINKTYVKYEECDIVDYNETRRALNNVDIVIHTAIVQIPQINEQKKLAYDVNFLGSQNVCKAVNENESIKGMILTGTWHIFGEKDLDGTIDEAFGFRPDKVEERARLYALSKIAQEVQMRYYDEMSKKVYGVIRMGTVLGEGMPEKTAANIFINRGIRGASLTPFKHSMYRPMLYVDIEDVCRAFEIYATKIIKGQVHKGENGVAHIVNLCWPKAITIIELARLVRDAIIKLTKGKTRPRIEVVDEGKPVLYKPSDKQRFIVDIRKVQGFLGMTKLTHPEKTIERIVGSYLAK